jgi:hypothetical protein
MWHPAANGRKKTDVTKNRVWGCDSDSVVSCYGPEAVYREHRKEPSCWNFWFSRSRVWKRLSSAILCHHEGIALVNAVSTSETSVTFNRTTHDTPEDSKTLITLLFLNIRESGDCLSNCELLKKADVPQRTYLMTTKPVSSVVLTSTELPWNLLHNDMLITYLISQRACQPVCTLDRRLTRATYDRQKLIIYHEDGCLMGYCTV